MKKSDRARARRRPSILSNCAILQIEHLAKSRCNPFGCTFSRTVRVSVGAAHVVKNCIAFPDIFNDPLCNNEVEDGDGCAFWDLLSLSKLQAAGSLVEGKIIMSDNTDMLIRLSERIRCATSGTAGLDAKEVASILCEIEDISARRMILSRFMASACSRGDVSETVAWTVVMSHMEGCRPSADVQLEAKHLISAH